MNDVTDLNTHPDWASPPSQSLRPEHRLLSAMVIYAMADYFILKRMGAINYFKITGYWLRRSDNSAVYRDMTIHDAYDLLRFLEHDAARVLQIIGWDVAPLEVRNTVLRLERSGAYRRLFAQGVAEDQGTHRVARRRKRGARA